MLDIKKLLTKMLHGENLTVVLTEPTITIAANSMSTVTLTPPSGYTKAILLSAYPRTTANITLQGVTVGSNIVRFYSEYGQSWTGTAAAYWLCVK